MPEHGISDDLAEHQSKLAVESRAYPLLRYNPDNGILPEQCLDLDGNPAPDGDWPSYSLTYTTEDGSSASMDVPLTFADFAMTEARFRKQFRTVPRDAWNDDMIPLAEFIELSADDRDGKFPFIWAVDRKNRLIRVIPAAPLVRASEDRRNFWRTLKSMAGVREQVDVGAIVEKARAEFAQSISSRLMDMVASGTVLSRPGVQTSRAAEEGGGTGSNGKGSSAPALPPRLRRPLWYQPQRRTEQSLLRGLSPRYAPPATSACGSTRRSSPMTRTSMPS